MRERSGGLSRRDFLKLFGAAVAATAAYRYLEPLDLLAPSLPEKAIRRNQAAVFAMPTMVNTAEDIKVFETVIGHRVHGVSHFADLDAKPPRLDVIEETLASGRTIMINLQPRPTADASDRDRLFTAESFTKGKHDAMLRKVARGMAGFGDAIIYNRFAFEMNMPPSWGFNWGGNPEGFKTMWRYAVNFFRSEGARNVKWIFSANYVPDQEHISEYYPGDDVVDVIGADIYDKDERPARHAVNKINYYLRQMAPTKPLIVSELGSAGYGRDEWLGDAVSLNLHQGVSAVNYFQINTDQNWRVNYSDSLPVMRKIFNSGAFLGDGASLEEINKTILTVN